MGPQVENLCNIGTHYYVQRDEDRDKFTKIIVDLRRDEYVSDL